MCLSRSVIVNYANTNTHNVIMPIRFLKNRNKNKIQWEADDDRLFVHEFRLSNDRVLFVGYMGRCKAHFELKLYTENILTVFSTACGSVTCATVIWLCIFKSKIAIDLILYSSMSVNVMCL